MGIEESEGLGMVIVKKWVWGKEFPSLVNPGYCSDERGGGLV